MNISIISAIKNKLRAFSNYIFILFSILFILSLVRNILRIKNVGTKVDEEKEKLSLLREQNEELKKEVEYLRSESYVEGQLRDKLGLAKEGETIVVLPEEEVVKKLISEKGEEVVSLPDPNWKKWYKLFFE